MKRQITEPLTLTGHDLKSIQFRKDVVVEDALQIDCDESLILAMGREISRGREARGAIFERACISP